ncbi:MAG TPA: creatininase family protein [Planctomycetota bacterium]|nr:creatininase family protein [Planctomycetota bacterium]
MFDLAKLAYPDVQALLARPGGCAAILPVGATEAHGPHLPLDTDVTIALGTARRAAALLGAAGRACVVLPPVAYSVAQYAAPFAGTLGVRPETAVAHVRDVLSAAVRAGFAPVAIANAHLEPAHIASLRAACEAVTAETGAVLAFPDVTRRRLAERLTEEFRSGACHAGRYEGSLVLADDPAAVQDEIRRALPAVPISLVDAMAAGRTDFVQAGGTHAYFGAPAEASAEEGRATYAVLAAMLVEAIDAARP